ncbi:hypothetical protein BC829DRAFT_416939 [Chytridium lagenaria]|nr:hypothetical protein BC829DRAFT_416939 [Chytridium lagenaria]
MHGEFRDLLSDVPASIDFADEAIGEPFLKVVSLSSCKNTHGYMEIRRSLHITPLDPPTKTRWWTTPPPPPHHLPAPRHSFTRPNALPPILWAISDSTRDGTTPWLDGAIAVNYWYDMGFGRGLRCMVCEAGGVFGGVMEEEDEVVEVDEFCINFAYCFWALSWE